ncbi:hypothetical protein GCM10015535_49360 [Streptomyces gelaticus]|uniref:Uncharacterized protein n=1 Tax=Streptomyces gelaticus TaxID=285446 RepID=A0ABQ2W3L3_9ACTN|nr:hypothetical protein GCM10015535_49360 [Streptomyces gelaticus]
MHRTPDHHGSLRRGHPLGGAAGSPRALQGPVGRRQGRQVRRTTRPVPNSHHLPEGQHDRKHRAQRGRGHRNPYRGQAPVPVRRRPAPAQPRTGDRSQPCKSDRLQPREAGRTPPPQALPGHCVTPTVSSASAAASA